MALGKHILVELMGCSSALLNDVMAVEKAMTEAAQAARATIIQVVFHHFSPYGVSGVVVIQESHLAIHTWPEHQYAAVDLFTCGEEADPWVACAFLQKALQAQRIHTTELKRGAMPALPTAAALPSDWPKGDLPAPPAPQYKREVWLTDKDQNIALSLRHTGELLYHADSPYQRVRVLQSHAYGKVLVLDDRVIATEKDEFAYHEMMVHVPAFLHGHPRQVLVIGGGDGGTVREVLKHSSVEAVTLVELDEKVVEAARLHLPQLSSALDDPRLTLLLEDGAAFLRTAPTAHYDLILVDGSHPDGPSKGLFSAAFYAHAYRALKPNGLLTTQSEGPWFHTAVFTQLYQTLGALFGATSVQCYLAYISTYPTGMWSFTSARKGAPLLPDAFDVQQATHFAAQQRLQYYSPAIHQAAFVLPPFVQRLLQAEA